MQKKLPDFFGKRSTYSAPRVIAKRREFEEFSEKAHPGGTGLGHRTKQQR